MKLTKAQSDIMDALLNDEPLHGLQHRRVAVSNLIRMGLVRWVRVHYDYNDDGTKHYYGIDTEVDYVELTDKAKQMFL